MTRTHTNFCLRIPQDVKFFIEEKAKKDDRSMNYTITKLLEAAMANEQKPSTQEKAPDDATSEAKSNH